MIPWRVYIFFSVGPYPVDRYYGEMIISDLHGAESPQMDVVTPTMGREMSYTCTMKKKGCFIEDTLADLDPGGSCYSTWMLALGVP
jgi:hypothetical protein